MAERSLVKSHRVAYPGGYTSGTGGQWLLDRCTLFNSASVDSGGGFHWQATSIPYQVLDANLDSMIIQDTFKMYFMYRPRGAAPRIPRAFGCH